MVNTSDILPNTPRYLKVPLIFFNSILWILGIILIAIGGYALNELKEASGLIYISLPAGLIVLGVFILILCIVGCIVAYREQLVGLIVYTVIMLILLICLIGVGAGAFSYRGSTDSVLNTAWGEADVVAQQGIEHWFDCCGWGPNRTIGTDFGANTTLRNGQVCFTGWDNTTETINGTQVNITTPIFNTNTSDCQPTVTDFINHYLYVAGVAGVVIGVIEFVCMFFSLYLIVRLCRNPRSRSYD